MSALILLLTLILIAPLAFVLGAAVPGTRTNRGPRPPRYLYSPGNHARRPPPVRGAPRRPFAPAGQRR
jgi:hypothetical protein